MTQNLTRDREAGTNCTVRTMLLLGQILWPKVAGAEPSQVPEEPLDSFNKLHDIRILELATRWLILCSGLEGDGEQCLQMRSLIKMRVL